MWKLSVLGGSVPVVTIDLRDIATTLLKEMDGSFALKTKDGSVLIRLAADVFQVLGKESLIAIDLVERKERLLGMRLDSLELRQAARVWRPTVMTGLIYASITTLRDLLENNDDALKQKVHRLGNRSIETIREGLTNINQEFGTAFTLAPDGPIIVPPLQTEAATLEDFLESPAANVVFAPGRETLHGQIVGAFRKALFKDIAETRLGKRRQIGPQGGVWENRARPIIDPLWERANVRDIIGVDLEQIPRRGPGFNTAVRTWLASVNARFNSSLEFGKKP
jgi:hypothetical protein